ncbi:MAG: ligase-associated DNA damage response endonuclease PdeM [Phycisphaerales bacterium]
MSEVLHDTSITLAGHDFRLLPERAVFWPERAWLLVADTHWGKCQTLRDAGAAVPSGPLLADLDRLRLVAHRTEATRVIILGDLVHGPSSLAPGMDELIRDWRPSLDCELAMVPGNHDRVIASPRGLGRLAAWQIELLPAVLELDGFRLMHEPPNMAGPATLCGHVHPAVRMRGRGESMKLPCFWHDRAYNTLVLPAFSSLVDGAVVKAEPGDDRWAIAGQRVMSV